MKGDRKKKNAEFANFMRIDIGLIEMRDSLVSRNGAALPQRGGNKTSSSGNALINPLEGGCIGAIRM